jgi:hypothetical protein
MREQNGGCTKVCCASKSSAWWVLKYLLILVVLICIFIVGVCVGARIALRRGTIVMNRGAISAQVVPPGYGMMKGRGGDRGMMNGLFGKEGSNWFIGGEEESASSTHLFGTIASVEDNKLTITDNAAKDQIVYSQADTRIMTSAGEVGLAALKVGQTVNVTGLVGQDGKTTATIIWVVTPPTPLVPAVTK